MSAQLLVSGTVCAGQVASGCSFPAGMTQIPFGSDCCAISAPVQTGDMVINVNSANAFVSLPGIGSAGPVTQASFLFVKVTAPMQIRVSSYTGVTTITSILYVNDYLVLRGSTTNYVSLLEAQGVGQVEYLAAGSQ